MDRMLYTAMSGATEMFRAQGVTANNLANATTTGFKKDLAVMMHQPVRAEDDSRHYGLATTEMQDFKPGSLEITNNPLDIAVDGSGWIAVQGQDGVTGYTRAGAMVVGGDGILRNRAGEAVMGNEGPISIPPDSQVEIAPDGTVNVFGIGEFEGDLALVDRIMLVNPDINQLRKGPNGLFQMKDGSAALPDPDVRVKSGALEGSNVSAVEALTEMIQRSRQYEMQVKMMKTANDLSQRSSSILRVS